MHEMTDAKIAEVEAEVRDAASQAYQEAVRLGIEEEFVNDCQTLAAVFDVNSMMAAFAGVTDAEEALELHYDFMQEAGIPRAEASLITSIAVYVTQHGVEGL